MRKTYTLSARNRATDEMRHIDVIAYSPSQVRAIFYHDSRNIGFRIVAIREAVTA